MYYIILGICYLLASLPFFILYGISDLLYLLVYYVFGYRKAVVMANLKQAFPEKSDAEIRKLAARYYRNLTDMMVETIKLLTMSKQSMKRRFDCDLTVLEELYAKGKSCQLHLGHNFNWEWANVFCMQGTAFPLLIVYMPLTSKTADRLFRYFRKRAGTVLLPANDMANAIAPWLNKQYLIGLVADQNPGNPRRSYWFPFLNKMTAFYKGPEMSARRYNIPVVFADIRKVKRGYYKARLVLASEDPQNTPEGQLTEQFVQFLEANIREQPEVWVWSHRRWKHQWKGETNETTAK